MVPSLRCSVFARLPLPRTVASLALLCLSGASAAQGGVVILPRIPLPFANNIYGGAGNTTLVGTTGRDELLDDAPNDTDILVDGGIGGPDGVFDWLETKDGDDNDFMIGGPEDLYFGDPGDKVRVIVSRNPDIVWRGRFDAWERGQAIFRWAKDRIQKALDKDGYTTWTDVFLDVQQELAAIDPGDAAVVSFASLFSLGPYVEGTLPASPGNCLLWYPFEGDPIASTSQMTMTNAQFQAARNDVQMLLSYLSTIGNYPLP